MIKVVIKTEKKSGYIAEMEIKGHSNHDEKGKDLICAAVSAVVIGGINQLNQDKFNLKIEDGYVSISSKQPVDQVDGIVLNTIEMQLKTIATSNPDYVKIFID